MHEAETENVKDFVYQRSQMAVEPCMSGTVLLYQEKCAKGLAWLNFKPIFGVKIRPDG